MTQTLPSRREFLCALAGCAAAASTAGCSDLTHTSEFPVLAFARCRRPRRKETIAELQKTNSEWFGKPVTVGTEGPMEGVEFGYALDISRCIGCRRCVYACVEENNQSRDPQVHWIRVLEMDKEKGVDFTHANAYYDAEKVPQEDPLSPAGCLPAVSGSCVKSCPVGQPGRRRTASS